MQFLYFLVAILATTIGSLAGIGGGVIIKPAMDFLGHYDLPTISVISSITVLSMAIVSTWRRFHTGYRPQTQIIYLGAGSVFGGVLGKYLFQGLLAVMDTLKASALQSIMLLVILFFVLIKKWLPKFKFENHTTMVIIGMTLGTVAAFLGIGGGPINVMVLMMFLGMEIKEAAVTSIVIIFLSQTAKVVTLAVTGGIVPGEISIVVFMIPAAIAGALLGGRLQHLISDRGLHALFDIIVITLIVLNGYNAMNMILMMQ